MGNTPASQQGSGSEGPTADLSHKYARLQELEKGRQHSITSQLFPSRKTRHSAVETASRNRKHTLSGPSVFKTNYSMAHSQDNLSGSTESIRDDMAGLTLKKSNDHNAETPSFLSPGPSASTVQPTREDALSVGDLGGHLIPADSVSRSNPDFSSSHRPSVVALMNSLRKDGDTSVISSKATTRSPSMDIYGALSLKSQSNGADKSMDFENILDDGYLQSEDIVLNQSLLQNVLKKDMKRKRSINNGHDSKKSNITTNTSHEARLKVSSTSFSYESLESGALPELKKPKSLSTDEGVLPSFHSTSVRNENQDRSPSFPHPHLGITDFDRIDSFEKKSVEHREGAESLPHSFSSNSFSESERVNVILKFRDQIDNNASKVALISADILSALNYQPSSISGGLPLQYDNHDGCWIVPDLKLPPGIYKLQFLVDGFVRHSNFLPSATDSVGSIVNWFEVLPGYETIEPYREQIDFVTCNGNENNDNIPPHADKAVNDNDNIDESYSGKSTDRTSQHTLIAQPVPARVARPVLAGRHTSSYFKQDRTGTPYSDYKGISRTSSAVRKSPPGHQTVSSFDLLTALQPKKYEYSSEIPELFKAGNMLGQSDENTLQQPTAPPLYELSSTTSNILDCDQDTLFAKLQQGGLLDAETAEQEFLEQYVVPDLPIYLNSTYLNKIFSEFQNNSYNGVADGINHIIPHVNLNHLLTSSIRDEMISVGCTTRYEGKFITQVIYAPCYYASHPTE
ncbi:hypothetical protein HG535_0D04940 [Zygotorulaspora mrakii]|uniref:Association with the SNF1 complex (ASC) domain-containing protein n=1 Tax=Zygotorulaspora mrakii TaxID=42260 RepID=A0A7H9B2A1_ZYGMR|nr:uncharacterized protein HG535_0D04940 [Zygotorulaspora mrakii]QLG72785.1 hypothetical protein HG535_0D04940 [Zygotorulaspora mrakii]